MTLLHKLFFVSTLTAVSVMNAPTTTVAAMNPWAWTDVSKQVTFRADRPVWTMAHAGSYWFYSDGHEFSAGGHVWRTDGTNSIDITSDLQKVGLSRVDKIVNGGTSILFLKNMVLPSVEVVALNGATYTNRTTDLRAALEADQGILSIDGAPGMWGIVTTNRRALLWTDTTATVIALGSQNVSGIVHLGAGWLLVHSNDPLRMSMVDRSGAQTEITQKFPSVSRLDAIASSGAHVFLATRDAYGVTNFFLTNGTDVTRIIPAAAPLPVADWADARIGWNGASWMILSGKELVRFDGSAFQKFGKTRDYFVTLASDENGTLFLGGARSNNTLANGPTTPLLAKLVKVTEKIVPRSVVTTRVPEITHVPETTTASPSGQVAATTDTLTQGNSNGIAFWTWFTPNQNALTRDRTATYTVGAWSARSVSRIEIYVNDTLRKFCDSGILTSGNQSCAITLVGSEFAAGSHATVAAHITSADGKIGRTRSQALTIIDPIVTIALQTPPAASSVSTWTWIEPNLSDIDYRGSVRFKAQADTKEGVNRIDLYVNGVLRRMCDFARAYGIQTCDLTLNGLEVPVGTNVTFSAQARAASGDTIWSTPRTLAIRDNLKDAGKSPTVISTWMSPVTDIVKPGETVIFFANAQDIDGVSVIELLANKKITEVCTFTNAYTTVECNAPISTARYPDTNVVHMTARVTDAHGNVTLSNTRYFTFWK